MEMGIGQLGDACWKRKFRWLLVIDGVSGNQPINSLPPSKSARPSISFKTMEIQHLNETIYRPAKPDWKPITLTLFDMKRNEHPVFKWIKKQYNPANGTWEIPRPNEFVIANAQLNLYDGCGELMETWVYENVWIENAEFGDLDMSLSDIVMCDLTLRYDRAYIKGEESDVPLTPGPVGPPAQRTNWAPETTRRVPFNGIDDSFISNRGGRMA